VTAADVAGTSVDNIATADSDQTDGVTDDWTIPVAKLTIVKTATSQGPYKLNDVATFAIKVTNTGTTALHKVIITEAGVGAVLATDCVAGPSTGGVTLEPGASVTCSATHVVTQADFDKGTYTNVATVKSNETDPGTDDETIATPDPAVDLAIAKTSTATLLTVGQQATYQLTVSNNGPATATSVRVSDVIPANLSPVSAAGAGWTCTITGATVACTSSTSLAKGASLPAISVVVSVTGAGTGTIANTATVTGDQVDRDTTNNSSTLSLPTAEVLVETTVRATTTVPAVVQRLVTTGSNARDLGSVAVVLMGVGLVLFGIRRRRKNDAAS
jgi:uncharacterized repeat protein (TIGR01451 family)